ENLANQNAAADFLQGRGADQFGINAVNAAGTEAMRQKILAERKADADAAIELDQRQAAEQLRLENQNYAATEERRRKILKERLDSTNQISAVQQRNAEQLRRLSESAGRAVINEISSIGDIMEQTGGKFGKALERMGLDLLKFGEKILITKTLEDSLSAI